MPGDNSLKDMTKEERDASRQAKKEQKMKEREARAKMTPEQRKADREARKAEAQARREERRENKGMAAAETTTKKAHAIFAAILDPVAPKAVTFPLSEEDEILYTASRSVCECAPINAGRDAH